ncbi:ABC-type transport auxiliary lipoprotein family protein [Marimonas sp. MJW-29]|uniref:ABC-type transport auxiliary lipoprotein family protein n=1 Tax=Sulfitobacter sediminis TaxID=3234186 RepID=A0ABV3RRN1_9RHOB
MTQTIKLTRRLALLGAASALGGCSAVAALNSAAQPLDTYDLAPAAGAAGGRRSSRTLLVALPEASAAIATDRIMVKPDAASITYLPDARWSDELPAVFQSLLVRSISGTGRLGYVGRSEGGPIANTALLVRMDAFEVQVRGAGGFEAVVDLALTLLDDRSQRVIATRAFARTAPVADDTPTAIVGGFQSILDVVLPEMADWVVARS